MTYSPKRVIRDGRGARYPYLIAFVANPLLRTTRQTLVPDPILERELDYDNKVDHTVEELFGKLKNQQEGLLNHADLRGRLKIVSYWLPERESADEFALVEEVKYQETVSPRPDPILRLSQELTEFPDLVFVLTDSATYYRPAAFPTEDNRTRPGTAFCVDRRSLTHWHYCSWPGMATLHLQSPDLEALHEFAHAASSSTDGYIGDLYVDQDRTKALPRLNAKQRSSPKDKVPKEFGKLDGRTLLTSPDRGIGPYPPRWTSYHPRLLDTNNPAIMDSFKSGTIACRHDEMTAEFLLDRLRAKTHRK